ncbi:tyrosine-protein phosphatase [Bacillus solimangrovi]|uniref:Tyrosine-protein phosphatase n=1 Tax=Bacillus solimangrovi TaxID=1305675 RepID=A0A1E5LDI8_9BACI|nr:CpsB/CapC family capsule biosynthesis tyrosine phosphatase [Bacillus solimangrovi]OEH92136.1 tyrosine protein phosphatase [Bacillus solimangrovi]
MIDIHCHILPGVDDGAVTIDDSIKMARAASEEGISKIIATPHHKNGKYNNLKIDIMEHVVQLNKVLEKNDINVKILPGQEIRLNGELLSDYALGKILTLNNTNKYLFIELPSNHVPRYTERLIFDIQLQNLIPIIVHPERNSQITENPNVLYEFVKNGALTQITASSLTGHFGKKVKQFTHKLIDANLTHFIASDAHNITSRTFNLRAAYENIEQIYGMDMRYMFQENAQYLVNAEMVYKEPPERVKTKKFLGLF